MIASAGGGVLSDVEIQQRVERKELFIVKNCLDKEALRPASYDMQVAPDGLITPKGKRVKPGGNDSRPSKIVLQPGDAALLSTVEEFRMPPDVAGNITIKNRLATQGLMLLSGMLIDPGFGWHDCDDGELGRRLYLNVANIGKQAIEIRPGKDRIATIQFLRVHRCQSETQKIEAAEWRDQRLPSLGFLTELKDLKDRVERTNHFAQVILMLGFLVLAVTLIGISLSTILSLTRNSQLTEDLHHLKPVSVDGVLLLGFALLSFAVGVWPITRFVFKTPRRVEKFIKSIVADLRDELKKTTTEMMKRRAERQEQKTEEAKQKTEKQRQKTEEARRMAQEATQKAEEAKQKADEARREAAQGKGGAEEENR